LARGAVFAPAQERGPRSEHCPARQGQCSLRGPRSCAGARAARTMPLMSVAACSLLRSGRAICALAVAAVLVPASAAQAQDDRRPRDMSFELGAALGIFLPSDEHEFYDATQGPQEPISDIAPDILVRLGFYPRAF